MPKLVPTPGPKIAVPAMAPAIAAFEGNTTGLLTVPDTSSGIATKLTLCFSSTCAIPSNSLFGFIWTCPVAANNPELILRSRRLCCLPRILNRPENSLNWVSPPAVFCFTNKLAIFTKSSPCNTPLFTLNLKSACMLSASAAASFALLEKLPWLNKLPLK